MSSTIQSTDYASGRFAGLTAEELIRWASDEFETGLVMSTSFGIQSAVTLHLVSQTRPATPVIWVDTGYLPEETHRYAETLTSRLNLNLHIAKSPLSPAEMEAHYGRLWESDSVHDLNLYDQIRKVQPMQMALDDLGATAWISGLRADQTDYRSDLPRVRHTGGRYRIYPILHWNSRDIYHYMQQFGLPQHPLFAAGYTTVGDRHSSRPLMRGETDDRLTRFHGLKQECGLHVT